MSTNNIYRDLGLFSAPYTTSIIQTSKVDRYSSNKNLLDNVIYQNNEKETKKILTDVNLVDFNYKNLMKIIFLASKPD
jgi:hypothetical protein